jgi:hypothetical protein
MLDVKLDIMWYSLHNLCGISVFAETLPAGEDGDAYVMRLILHDWNDEDTVAILSNLRKAMGTAKTTLLLVEVRLLLLFFFKPGGGRGLFHVYLGVGGVCFLVIWG